MNEELSPLEVLKLHVCCYSDEELEEVLNKVRAIAWDEGYGAGHFVAEVRGLEERHNPYVEEQ